MKYTTQIFAAPRYRADLAAAIAGVVGLAACGSSAARLGTASRRSTAAFQAMGRSRGSTCSISLGVTRRPAAADWPHRTSGTERAHPAGGRRHRVDSSLVIDLQHRQRESRSTTTRPTATSRPAVRSGPPGRQAGSGQLPLCRPDDLPPGRRWPPAQDLGQDPSKAARLPAGPSGANSYVPGLAALGQGNWVSVPSSRPRHPAAGLQSKLPSSSASAAAHAGDVPADAARSCTSLQVQHHLHRSRHPGWPHRLQVYVSSRPFVQQVCGAAGVRSGMPFRGRRRMGKNIKAVDQQDPGQPEGSSSMCG